MDRWTSMKFTMEKALEMGNLGQALYYLDALIVNASSPSDVPDLLRNHTVKDLPTFHYLIRFPFSEEDIPHLDKLIRIFTVSGYDINQIVNPPTRQRTTRGVTALLESINQENVILVECLLRQGARADIRDPKDLTPCHWAIRKNKLNCLETLLEHGGSELVTSARIDKGWGEVSVLPLLHEAVDEGHLDIVLYLLSKEELGVDSNEVAFHWKYPADVYLSHEYGAWRDPKGVPSHDNDDDYQRGFTPLGRALDLNDIPIIQALVNHPGANPSRFDELHRSLKYGDTEKALSLLKYFSDDELSTDKVEDQWPLHSIHPLTFQSKFYMKFTKKLILEYVARGWDPNSESTAQKTMKIHFADYTGEYVFTKYTLLHLACLYKLQEIIKWLVENLGVDINRKMEGNGNIQLTPVQILLVQYELESAGYLIEKGADVNLRGDLGILGSFRSRDWGRKYLHFMRKNAVTGEFELISSLNAVELMLRMGFWRYGPFLYPLLSRPDVVLHGTNEFHLAVEGGNRDFIRQILERYAEVISHEDLNWVTFCGDNGEEPEKVSCLIWLLGKLVGHFRPDRDNVDSMADLVKRMAQLGCDLNTSRRKGPVARLEGAPLLFYILRYDLDYQTSNRLLKTILQFDSLRLNVTNEAGLNPVDYILDEWDSSCSCTRDTSMCLKSRGLLHPPILETVQLLVTHGLDVSGMVIGPEFTYHRGFNYILKTLYYAGAKISEEFFTSATFCHWSSRERDALAKEIAELKEWKDAFDRETGISLMRICGLQIRKTLRCIGDLKMLGIPKSLNAVVQCSEVATLSRGR